MKGNSGCSLESNKDFVTKSATGKYAARLKEQCYKQKSFLKTELKNYDILAVPVTKIVEDKEDSFSFEMYRSRGKTLAELIKESPCEKVAEDLCEFLYRNKQPSLILNAFEKLDKKLWDLEHTLPEEYVADIDVFRSKCFDKLVSCAGGYCHGDFTLENILISGRQIQLIDFLDSFMESPLMDFSTILQDSKCHWSYRYEELTVAEKANIESFNDIIEKFLNEKGLYPTVLAFLLLKLYRIVPYTKDDETKEWLKVNIDSIKKELYSKC